MNSNINVETINNTLIDKCSLPIKIRVLIILCALINQKINMANINTNEPPPNKYDSAKYQFLNLGFNISIISFLLVRCSTREK